MCICVDTIIRGTSVTIFDILKDNVQVSWTDKNVLSKSALKCLFPALNILLF